jgi:long-subunit fatty acid transport protein
MKFAKSCLCGWWKATCSSVFVITAVAGILPSCASAQSLDSVALFQETLQSDFFGVDARAIGMGNTGLATSHDASAIIYNPANLARVRRIEFRGGLSHLRTSNDTRMASGSQEYEDGRDLTKTRINALSLTMPVPAYRGSLVFAFGLHRVNSFDRSAGLQYAPPQGYDSDRAREMETGGLWKWSVAGALDISPRLSAGLSTHLLSGSDAYRWNRVIRDDNPAHTINENQSIDIDYVGVAATAGITYAISHELTAGLSVETPTWLQAEERHSLLLDTASSSYEWVLDDGIANYTLTRPFSFGFGLSGEFNRLTLAGDLRYSDWSQLDISYDDASLNNTPELQFIQDNLKETFGWNLGAEYLFPAQGINLRAGYFVDPLPIDSRFVESQRKYLTLGVGFLIDRVMALDLAYVHGGYQLRDTNPGNSFTEYKTRRVFVTFGYRI